MRRTWLVLFAGISAIPALIATTPAGPPGQLVKRSTSASRCETWPVTLNRLRA